ncbi:MAG: RDD family protein [Acidimicrobiales bacterium]
MKRASFAPTGVDVPLAGWGVRAVGAVADAVVVGVATYLVDLAVGIHGRVAYGYLDVLVSFAYSFALVGFWGHTLGMAFMRLSAVDAIEGRTPIGPLRAAVRSFVAGLLTLIPLAPFLDLCWPLWDPRNQTLHDKAAGTLVLRH